MTIYRGYEIQPAGNEFAVYAEPNSMIVFRAPTEDAAMNWIDKTKREQRKIAEAAQPIIVR